MKAALALLVTVASMASGAWLKWTADTEATWYPAVETGAVAHEMDAGWSPKPTAAPGIVGQGEAILELLRRDDATTTNWTNSETCGWVSGVSCQFSSIVEDCILQANKTTAFAWTCANGYTCATNDEHAVACASGNYQPFYVSCFDFEASKAGSCDSLASNTGCW